MAQKHRSAEMGTGNFLIRLEIDQVNMGQFLK